MTILEGFGLINDGQKYKNNHIILEKWKLTRKNKMESNLIVMKFGGTSVKNQDHISLVSRKIRYEILRGNKVVTVVSAQGDTTDRLLEASKKINNKPNFRIF